MLKNTAYWLWWVLNPQLHDQDRSARRVTSQKYTETICINFLFQVLIELGTVCYKLGMLSESYSNYMEALSRQPKPKTPAEKLGVVKTFIGIG